ALRLSRPRPRRARRGDALGDRRARGAPVRAPGAGGAQPGGGDARRPPQPREPREAVNDSAAPQAPRHVFLIDASGYVFRAYHALPPLNRADGTPTSAVLGFVNMILKLLESTDADHVAAVFDAAHVSFRNEIYDQYKANRTAPPDDLVPQFKLVREACDAFHLGRTEAPNYEADALLATSAREAHEAGAEVTIVSSDKDLMQLVHDGIPMWAPIKERPIGPAEVREKFGVG